MENKKSTICSKEFDYCGEIKSSPFTRPSFVNSQHDWSVQPSNDYDSAYQKGIQYAAHFAQYLADNPDKVGSNILGIIAQDMASDGNTADNATQGYAVGFFSFLERLIYYAAEHIDVFTYAQQLHDDHRVGARRGNLSCMRD